MPDFKRNEKGLLESVEYKFKPTQEIDWRAMVSKEFLYINYEYKEELEARFNKKLRDIDVGELEDRYLLIMLAGIKELLRLRGFKSVKYHADSVTDSKAVYTCTIEFIGNYETGGEPVIFSDCGSASLYSVSGTFQVHLEAIAANRAFVRCVRNFLGINTVGKDEFDPRANADYARKLEVKKLTEEAVEPENTGYSANSILTKRCQELDKNGSHSFEKIKESAIKSASKFTSDPTEWNDFASIPAKDTYILLNLLNKTKKS